ncbi:hypothetical protein RCG67_06090 [Kocuria sp. CPCC 205292]|uniref:hypothetical protein n=1 Tax=Kocuria cellulosilytica TaxID=3071451 RepID=UPI0034D4E5D1
MCAPRCPRYRATLYFLPLPAMVLLQLIEGFDHQLDALDIGHIVNLARGHTREQQLLQILVAVAIGRVLDCWWP